MSDIIQPNLFNWQDVNAKSDLEISKLVLIFTPMARSSYTWKREYDKRSSVERVNSRFARVYKFENHFIRGLPKMEMRTGLAMVVMLAIAVGQVKAERVSEVRKPATAA